MSKEKLIVFVYDPNTLRTHLDGIDMYNWLLDQNEKIADKFLKKMEEAVEIIKKRIDH